MGIFSQIDFANLPDNFSENSVREEIITPLLNLLGYSTFNSKYNIRRDCRLKYPYIYIGTTKTKIEIIPDYIVAINNKPVFIVEAKSPSENIRKGKNVGQAYSYAIHTEINTKRFVLCNGIGLSIFEVDKTEPILYFEFAKASNDNYEQLYDLLSPVAFTNPHLLDFKLDYGLYCYKNRLANVTQYFYNCQIDEIAKLNDTAYTFSTTIKRDLLYYATFDFDAALYLDFLEQVPDKLKEEVKIALSNAPFKYHADDKSNFLSLSFKAILSETVYKNANEHYLPLRIIDFF